MTRKNNFTRAPEGQPDIEFVGFMDCGESQRLFKENFEILEQSNRGSTIAYYIDNGNVPGADAITFTVKGDKAVKIAKLVELTSFDDSEIQTWDDDTIDTELLGYYDVTLIDYALDRLDVLDGLGFVPSKNLITLTTKGYSQGDYAKVIYCPDDCAAEWGKMPDQSAMQTMFDHLFWDAPYYACMTINGEEYNLYDMPDYNEYEWDSAAFLAYVAKESGIDIAILESFIPQHLEY